MKLKKTQSNFLFVFLLVIVSILYNYPEILFYPPYSIHLWRQADCLSITLNYYKEHLPFLTPKIHWTSPSGDNKTISEFPIIYYLVAQLWELFGQKEFIFRLVNILFVFTGLFFLYKLSMKYFNDTFWAFFIPLFLFTSPILVYYTNNFLADAPALGMAFAGSYFYYIYLEEKERRALVLAIVFLTLAGLLKISSLIPFTALLLLYLLDSSILIVKRKIEFRNVVKKFSPFLIVIAILAVWYTYARYYTKIHNSGVFLQSIYPIWGVDTAKRHEIMELFYWKLLPAFFNKKALALLAILTITAIGITYKSNKKMIHFFIIAFMGVIAYLVLWYQALNVHDYYLTNLLMIIPLMLFLILGALKTKFFFLFQHWSVKTIATIGLLCLIYQTTMINRIKYNANDSFLRANLLIEKPEIDYWKYVQWEYGKTKKALETVTPYLRNLGISRDDIVYCTPDNTINHTLYLMDQRGYTDYSYSELQGIENINKRIAYFKQIGAKYLVVCDPEILKNIDGDILSKKIGEYKNVLIYSLVN